MGSFLEIYDEIYTTYSYRHNHLYNNDTLTTVVNYDFARVVFFVVLIVVSMVLFIQEVIIKKKSR